MQYLLLELQNEFRFFKQYKNDHIYLCKNKNLNKNFRVKTKSHSIPSYSILSHKNYEF